MTLDEFLISPAVELPKQRKDDLTFHAFLHKIFLEYTKAVSGLGDDDVVCRNVKSALPEIKSAMRYLEKSVLKYLQGFPHAAYDQLEKATGKLDPSLQSLKLQVGDSASIRVFERLYRIRLAKLAEFKRRDLFHVPFELRHCVSTQRYSISGLPSLYLAGSLWCCWEELQRPDFHEIQMARFRYSSPMTLLDFGFRPSVLNRLRPTYIGDALLTSYLVCWPLLAACSIRVLYPGMPFIPEYIVPQLLLQWVRNEASLDGLRYFSTKINQDGHSPWAAMNYVFPVQEQSDKGFCPKLKDKFCLSAPCAWSIVTRSNFVDVAMRPDPWQIPVNEDRSISYFNTEFFECEQKLEGLTCDRVDVSKTQFA
jgi:hypothetical protein